MKRVFAFLLLYVANVLILVKIKKGIKMKILVVGSGGREHAICLQLSKSPKIERIYCAPGNGGTLNVAQNIDILVTDFDKLAAFAKENDIDFTFVGPETPLSYGIVDYFESRGLKVIGPSRYAAKLESSKIYAKKFMQKYNIPTARYNSFEKITDAIKFVESLNKDKKIVIKADGLAAGKGVYICNNREDAFYILKHVIENYKTSGDLWKNIIFEEYIDGPELSYLIFTDGVSYSMMPASQDHKRLNDGNKGPNTGGMGAYVPVPFLATKELNKKIEIDIIRKLISGIKSEKLDYKGVLYVGIILCNSSPHVLEFNCRFGDPEAQALLPLLDTDLVDICNAILDKKLSSIKIKWKKKFSICLVLVSGGYPGYFEKKVEIKGLNSINDKFTTVFHAGTQFYNGRFITSGGRVLGITSVSEDIKSAVDKVYSSAKLVSFKNMHYRKDIGRNLLKFLKKESEGIPSE
ncbi:MAG: phosphoribosylamine--glycine ligase [Endomicrobium sp.]|nr:phosphoribosylamine--glycine ligase [Endomicrobium sp.]